MYRVRQYVPQTTPERTATAPETAARPGTRRRVPRGLAEGDDIAHQPGAAHRRGSLSALYDGISSAEQTRAPVQITVGRRWTTGGVSRRITGPADNAVMEAFVRSADGTLIGDGNVQRNVTDLRLHRPAVTLESASAGAAYLRAFDRLLEKPDSHIRRAAFRSAATNPNNRLPSGPVCFGTTDGRTRVTSLAVGVRSSRGVVVANHTFQTNRFRYTVRNPSLSLPEVAAHQPALADAVIRLVARPDDERRQRVLGLSLEKALRGLDHEQWVPYAARVTPDLRRPGGVAIGRDVQQINTGRVRFSSVDVSAAVGAVRDPASDLQEVRRLDTEYAAMADRLDGELPTDPAGLAQRASVLADAIANRRRLTEIQDRRLERCADDPTSTRWGRSKIAASRAIARDTIADLTKARAACEPTTPERVTAAPVAAGSRTDPPAASRSLGAATDRPRSVLPRSSDVDRPATRVRPVAQPRPADPPAYPRPSIGGPGF